MAGEDQGNIVSQNFISHETLTFQLIDPSDERWKTFINRQADATIFHHPAWIELLSECYGYRPFIVAMINQDGKICAGLPMMEVNSFLTGRRWVSLPFSDYCNPLFDNLDLAIQLMKNLIYLKAENRISKIELRWDFQFGGARISCPSSFLLHTLELKPNDLKNTLSHVHRTQLQNVRRAEKEGIRIVEGKSMEHMKSFYHHQCITRHRHGLPVQPWKFFEMLFHRLLEKGLGFLLLAYQGEQCLSSGVFLYTQQTLTYKYSASNGIKDLRSNHLLTWHAIRWGCMNEFKQFDFGRTDIGNIGLRTYKTRWGAIEAVLNYSELSDSGLEHKKRSLMPLAKSIIDKSPQCFSSIIGKLLYKHFG